FGDPTKPIGPFFGRDQAQRLAAERKWTVRPDSGRGYRRVVASPQPMGIIEINAIRALVDAGLLIIAAGSGGIPGPAGSDGPAGAHEHARDVFPDAVIDKDRAARLLATQLGAQALLLVTAVDRVMLDYGTPRQAGLATITADEAARHLAEGQFPSGSMGPKIEAALEFLASGGELAGVTTPAPLAGAPSRAGPGGGTRVAPAPPRNRRGRGGAC